VKFCTNRFRGNVTDLAARAMAIQAEVPVCGRSDILPTGRTVNIYSSSPTAVPVAAEATRVTVKAKTSCSLASIWAAGALYWCASMNAADAVMLSRDYHVTRWPYSRVLPASTASGELLDTLQPALFPIPSACTGWPAASG
jgi:hypothetical protein